MRQWKMTRNGWFGLRSRRLLRGGRIATGTMRAPVRQCWILVKYLNLVADAVKRHIGLPVLCQISTLRGNLETTRLGPGR